MNPDEVETLREGWDFEAKLAKGRYGGGKLPDALWETYSAMANTEGGLILLGAKEMPDGSLDFLGIRDIDKVERDLWTTAENTSKISANLLSRDSVEQIEIDGRKLLLLSVPKASRAQRPVFVNGSWERGTYVRIHEGDHKVSREVARRMLADSVADRDSHILEDYTLDDLHGASVRRYREFFVARRPDHPFLQKDNTDLLIAIGAARRERGKDTSPARPTWAGLLMLGEETAIRELLPSWHLSYKELPNDPGDTRRWIDRIHPDGTWNANLFEFYLRAIVKLHDGLKVPFVLEHGQFRKDETPVHDAVREAFVNALIHADYQGNTGLRAIKRRSGFEFINPGLMLITIRQLWQGGISEPRNPVLQRLFGVLRLGEREGSGGPAMRRIWREQHWRAPRVWEDVEHGETHIQFRQESLLPGWAVEMLVGRFGEGFTKQDELGRLILVTAEVEESIAHVRIRELSEAHPRDITLKLQDLVRRGLLESSGKTRGMTYSPCILAALPLFDTAPDRDILAETLPEGSSPSSDHSALRSGHSAPKSGHSAPRSGHKESDSDHSGLVARVAGQRRISPSDFQRAVLWLCRSEFQTALVLTERLNRSIVTVRRHLRKLVGSGALELCYPDKPNHPAQSYRATLPPPSEER